MLQTGALVWIMGLRPAWAGCAVEGPAQPSPSARRPAVLLLETPGYSPATYLPLREALEQQRLTVWNLRCDDPAAQLAGALPEALERSSARALVGHGLGGTLVAQAVAAGWVAPEALGLLGAPLLHRPEMAPRIHSAIAAAELPLPSTPVTLAGWLSAPWADGQPLAEVLLGSPLPPLGAVSVGWLETVQGWSTAAWEADLRALPATAVWAGVGGLDNLAPAEVVRPMLPPDSLHRYGYLGRGDHDPDNTDLLAEQDALRDLARWLRRTL